MGLTVATYDANVFGDSVRHPTRANNCIRMQLATSSRSGCLACLPRGRDGGTATARAALTEFKRMDKILTLLILPLQVVKLLLEHLNR